MPWERSTGHIKIVVNLALRNEFFTFIIDRDAAVYILPVGRWYVRRHVAKTPGVAPFDHILKVIFD